MGAVILRMRGDLGATCCFRGDIDQSGATLRIFREKRPEPSVETPEAGQHCCSRERSSNDRSSCNKGAKDATQTKAI